MSDADDQMGGSGGETGRPPGGAPASGAAEDAARGDVAKPSGGAESGEVDEESEESFPASDPPANY